MGNKSVTKMKKSKIIYKIWWGESAKFSKSCEVRLGTRAGIFFRFFAKKWSERLHGFPCFGAK